MTAIEIDTDRKRRTRECFEALRDKLCATFEEIEQEHCGQLSERPAG